MPLVALVEQQKKTLPFTVRHIDRFQIDPGPGADNRPRVQCGEPGPPHRPTLLCALGFLSIKPHRSGASQHDSPLLPPSCTSLVQGFIACFCWEVWPANSSWLPWVQSTWCRTVHRWILYCMRASGISTVVSSLVHVWDRWLTMCGRPAAP